jgi:hypothetical protein
VKVLAQAKLQQLVKIKKRLHQNLRRPLGLLKVLVNQAGKALKLRVCLRQKINNDWPKAQCRPHLT